MSTGNAWPVGGLFGQTATATSTFQAIGKNPGPGTADLATNPSVTTLAGDPLQQAIMFLGRGT